LQTLTLCRATKFAQLSMRLDDFRGLSYVLDYLDVSALGRCEVVNHDCKTSISASSRWMEELKARSPSIAELVGDPSDDREWLKKLVLADRKEKRVDDKDIRLSIDFYDGNALIFSGAVALKGTEGESFDNDLNIDASCQKGRPFGGGRYQRYIQVNNKLSGPAPIDYSVDYVEGLDCVLRILDVREKKVVTIPCDLTFNGIVQSIHPPDFPPRWSVACNVFDEKDKVKKWYRDFFSVETPFAQDGTLNSCRLLFATTHFHHFFDKALAGFFDAA